MTRIAAQRTTRISHTIQRPPAPLHGALAAALPRPPMTGDPSPYTADSVPLSRLETLDLRTITPPPLPFLVSPGTGVFPAGLVHHCAPESRLTCGNKAQQNARSHTGVTSSHTRPK